MNKKLFLIVLVLCVSMQSGFIFCSEKPMGWIEYLTSGWRGGDPKPTLARQIYMKMYNRPQPTSVFQEEKEDALFDPETARSVAKNFYGTVAKEGITNAAYLTIAAAVAYIASGKVTNNTYSVLGGSYFAVESGSNSLSILSKAFLDEPLKYIAGPSLLCSVIINAIYAQLGQGYIAVDKGVSLVKSTIAQMFSNSLDFPTRSSKIRALLKKNEWYIPLQNDGFSEQQSTEIMDRACGELGQEIWNVKISEEQKAKDKKIDGLMQKIRMDLQGKSLDEQIAVLQQSQKTGTLNQLLQDPEVIANHAMLAGFVRQKVVEATEAESLNAQREVEAESLARRRKEASDAGLTEDNPQWPQQTQSTFEKTSAAKFYQPIPENAQNKLRPETEGWKAYTKQQRKLQGVEE